MLSPTLLVGEWVSSCRGLSCELELNQDNLLESWGSKQAAEQIVKSRILGHPSDINMTEDIVNSCQLPNYSILFNYLFHLLPQNFSSSLKQGLTLHCRTLRKSSSLQNSVSSSIINFLCNRTRAQRAISKHDTVISECSMYQKWMKAANHTLGCISKRMAIRLRNFLPLGILRPHMKYCIQFSTPPVQEQTYGMEQKQQKGHQNERVKKHLVYEKKLRTVCSECRKGNPILYLTNGTSP